MEKISVIVPVFKTEKYLNRCIKSIVNQTYKNLEIILVDDGSTDNCPKICDDWSNKDDRIVVIHKKNGGVSSARNIGINHSNGKYISFVDSDDYIDQDMLSKLVNCLKEKKSDISICNYYPNTFDFFELDKKIKIDVFYNMLFDKKYYRGYLWNKLYRSDIIKNNQLFFDDNICICEDLLFNCKYALHCCNASVVNEKLYYYNDDSDSALNSPLTEKYLTVLDAYDKIFEISHNMNCDLNIVKISYFKVITDIIYRNHISKSNLLIEDINKKKNKLYKSINKKQLSFKLRIELYIYKNFPILIGYARRKLRRRKK